jgi:hypothetical protein
LPSRTGSETASTVRSADDWANDLTANCAAIEAVYSLSLDGETPDSLRPLPAMGGGARVDAGLTFWDRRSVWWGFEAAVLQRDLSPERGAVG